MHKKPSKKKGKFSSTKTANVHRKFKISQTQKNELKNNLPNEVVHVSQLFKSKPEERREKTQIELKIRRKDEKLLSFDANRKLSEYSSSIKADDVELLDNNKEEFVNKFTDKSGKTYCKELKKVIEASNVILEVLDARDPQGTRSLPVEEMIMSAPNKRLILVLNKADLVPKDCLDAWLKYFRSQHPTLLFKSSTQKQAANLSHAKIKNSKYTESFKTSKCVGASALMQLLKNYCRNSGIKTVISVGVVGLPNVGKSSLINSLKRMKACTVGATPGVTKTMQEVSLDSKIRIIDCPGLILSSKNESDAQASLRNAFKIEKLKDLITPVQAILEKVGKEEMLSIYKINDFDDIHEFLSYLALKNGRVKKGGSPDVDKAAVMVLRDWNNGKIKYFSYPPTPNENDIQLTSAVIGAYSKEFNLDELDEINENELKSLSDEDDYDSSMEDTPEGQNNTHKKESFKQNSELLPSKMGVQRSSEPKTKMNDPKPKTQMESISTLPLRKLQKKQMKKFNKEKRRNEKRAEELTDDFENINMLMDSND